MDREEQIRQRAYQLWEQDGRPVGREDEHWRRARDEVETAFGHHGPEADDEAEAANERAAARLRGDGGDAQDLMNSTDPIGLRAAADVYRRRLAQAMVDQDVGTGGPSLASSDMVRERAASAHRDRQLRNQTGGGLSDDELSLGAGDAGASDLAVSDRTGRAVDQLSGAEQPSPAAGETGSRGKRP